MRTLESSGDRNGLLKRFLNGPYLLRRPIPEHLFVNVVHVATTLPDDDTSRGRKGARLTANIT